MAPDKYDLLTASLTLVAICGIAISDMLLYSIGGEQATFSAYLRKILIIHPAITSAVSIALGALWAHIFLCR